jgi:HrpA-like RNA helicase
LAAYQNNPQDQTVSEIQRTELMSVLLTMLATGIRDIVGFSFLDSPLKKQLFLAVEELYHLGAITMEGELIDVGVKISRLPLETKLAKALIGAKAYHCTEEMCSLVAMLSEATRSSSTPGRTDPPPTRPTRSSMHALVTISHSSPCSTSTRGCPSRRRGSGASRTSWTPAFLSAPGRTDAPSQSR